MILVLSGTNRPSSKTRIIAEHIVTRIKSLTKEKVSLISLEDIAADIYHHDMYAAEAMSDELKSLQDDIFIPSSKLIVVSPEYNGSFPGSLKLFIDALSIRKYAENFKNKHVALVGVASGRAGNLRGMEHLTGLMNYLGMHVFPNKLPISSIEKQLDEESNLNEATQEAISNLLKGFLAATEHV